jgi:hypothetical protein
MPRKPAPKPDNPEQYKRFLQTAREAGADEPGEAFDRVLRKVADGPRESKPVPATKKP